MRRGGRTCYTAVWSTPSNQGKVTQMINAKLRFKPLCCFAVGGHHDAGIIDQDIYPVPENINIIICLFDLLGI